MLMRCGPATALAEQPHSRLFDRTKIELETIVANR
jgi:hypothetical protein